MVAECIGSGAAGDSLNKPPHPPQTTLTLTSVAFSCIFNFIHVNICCDFKLFWLV